MSKRGGRSSLSGSSCLTICTSSKAECELESSRKETDNELVDEWTRYDWSLRRRMEGGHPRLRTMQSGCHFKAILHAKYAIDNRPIRDFEFKGRQIRRQNPIRTCEMANKRRAALVFSQQIHHQREVFLCVSYCHRVGMITQQCFRFDVQVQQWSRSSAPE